MSGWLPALTALVSAGVGLWLLSLIVETFRRVPPDPQVLRWAPDIPIEYLALGGIRLRYIKAGHGPVLVLLHTLRTQLDLFEKVVPEFARTFTVYAIDYPGHGYSDIPDAPYDADFFADVVSRALDALDLRNATLCGVSIGASVALILAGRGNPRVNRVVATNPYDYGKGRGMGRGSWQGWLTVSAADIPILGETFMRLRSFPVTKAIRHSATWESATGVYGKIAVPVRLVWGDHDWARGSEREHDGRLIPGVQMVTVERGGHFLPLDRPDVVIDELKSFMS